MKTSLLALLLWLSAGRPAVAQSRDSLGGKVKTYFPAGRARQARAYQQLVQEAARFYEEALPGPPFVVGLNVRPTTPVPYYDDETNRLVVGASKQAPQLFQPADGSSADTVDLVAVHELGHYYFYTLHPTAIPTKWAGEFFASYFAICYLETRKGLSMRPSAPAGPLPQYRTLADFERLYYGVGGPNYGWYQGRFAALAYALYPKFKTKLVKIAFAEYGPTGKPPPPTPGTPENSCSQGSGALVENNAVAIC
ncbi:hypothetical protein IC235_17325 [Hymenobacter sp. BT664]|uniref:Peptidase MA-like domain-containing protein n=1 Tax=Hymenobacter montanus TaxID=2771359 RepID=A0A927BGB4_9BACT|nr:hypothetical protein [Hymenobacter montanus]MBD2769654.1 hypothetical protein [Hymenobacter montanus]